MSNGIWKDERDPAPIGAWMSHRYWMLGLAVLLAGGAAGCSTASNREAEAATVSQPIEVEGLDDPAKLMRLARGVSRGDPDAPITIIELGDFQCPVCGDFDRLVKPRVDAELIQTGRANFVFHDFPLSMHPNAFFASRAARCAEDQDAFWAYHDVLFHNQDRWSPLENPADAFEAYARALELDEGAFRSCLRSDRHADVVTANLELAMQLQAPGTPTILVTRGRGMGQRVPNSFEGIRAAVAALEDVGGGSR